MSLPSDNENKAVIDGKLIVSCTRYVAISSTGTSENPLAGEGRTFHGPVRVNRRSKYGPWAVQCPGLFSRPRSNIELNDGTLSLNVLQNLSYEEAIKRVNAILSSE